MPNNAKMHFNYSNFLRDSQRTEEAINTTRLPSGAQRVHCYMYYHCSYAIVDPCLLIMHATCSIYLQMYINSDSMILIRFCSTSLAPDHAVSHNNLGTLLELEEVEFHFREAVHHNPQHHRAFYNLGQNLEYATCSH